MAKSSKGSSWSDFGKVKLSSYSAPQYSKSSASNNWNNLMSFARYRMGNKYSGSSSDAVNMAAKYLGINQVNKPEEMRRINDLLAGADSSWARAKAAKSGIKKYDSYNDYFQLLGPSPNERNRGPIGPAPSSSPSPGINSMEDEPLFPEITIKLPEEKPVPIMGVGEDLASTATGFKTRRSSRRMASSAAQGYGSMTIAPKNTYGVGLNV